MPHDQDTTNFSKEDVTAFIRATGGGKGEYRPEGEIPAEGTTVGLFHQAEPCTSNFCKPSQGVKSTTSQEGENRTKGSPFGLGFGRITFPSVANDPKLFVRVPHDANSRMLLHFVENVWNLPRPKLLIGITGGAMDFPVSPELELVLNDLMNVARHTDAWLITGGTRGGIMKYFGLARYRFGGTIPLIGFATWGSIANRQILEVEGGSINYGYVTRDPVNYEDYVAKSKDDPQRGSLLDQNHSHFILADDGTVAEYGREHNIRGSFESDACCVAEEDESERFVSEYLVSETGIQFGWEGSNHVANFSEKGEMKSANTQEKDTKSTEKNRAICLCFQGGPGTLGTVQTSTKYGTPVLVIQGTGRAADLIADCVQSYEDSLAKDGEANDDDDDIFVLQDSFSGDDKVKRNKAVLVRRFLTLMSEIQTCDSKESTQSSFKSSSKGDEILNRLTSMKNRFPVDDIGKNIRDEIPSWSWQRQVDQSRKPIWVDKNHDLDNCLEPDSEKHFHWTLKLGWRLFKAYELGVNEKTPVEDIMKFISQLYDVVISRRCLAYKLGARKMINGKSVRLSVHEYMSKCIIRGMREDFKGSKTKLRICLKAWKKVTRTGIKNAYRVVNEKRKISDSSQYSENIRNLVLETLPDEKTEKLSQILKVLQSISDEKILLPKDELVLRTELTEIRKLSNVTRGTSETSRFDALFEEYFHQVFELLIEWGQTDLVKEKLGETGNLSKDLLNRVLELALENDNCQVAIHALELGANTEIYGCSSLCTRWKRLLMGASDDPEEHYLLSLIRTGSEELEKKHDLGSSRRKWKAVSNADGIEDDAHAVAILNEIYKKVVTYDPSGEPMDQSLRFHFTLDENNQWAGADFNLFLCLLLMNRSDLVHLFFMKESKQNAAAVLPNALWASLICKQLGLFPGVGTSSYHLKNGFETTANKYEQIAASVLRIAYDQSEMCALKFLEKPLKRCDNWSSFDLIVKADCKEVIAKCPEVCITAVQHRFFGEEGLPAALTRMNKSLKLTFESLLSLTKQEVAASTEHNLTSKGNSGSPSKSSMQKNPASDSTVPESSQISARMKEFALCVLVDAIGVSYYVYPILPINFYMYCWAPISAALNSYLIGYPCLTVFALVEEMLPIVDLLPSATIGWFIKAQEISDNKKRMELLKSQTESERTANEDQEMQAESIFVPVDYFILDVLMHCLLSYLMTVVVLLTPSPVTFMVEIVVALVILSDEVPDVLLAGISDEDESSPDQIPIPPGTKPSYSLGTFFKLLSSVGKLGPTLSAGIVNYLADNGERFEMASAMIFFVGFFIRYISFASWFILYSDVCKMETMGGLSYILYGLAVFMMWLRTLSFVLVQQELGQFVRVMQNMAKDLAFFTIVWGILILAFSTAMLGAHLQDTTQDHSESKEGDEEGNPMQSWAMWWFIRTYLQSLGQDYLDEMTTGPSNVIFLLMWPIFNVLLVNLLVAVMGDRYESAKEESQIAYCLDLYQLDETIRTKGRTNVITLIWTIFHECEYGEGGRGEDILELFKDIKSKLTSNRNRGGSSADEKNMIHQLKETVKDMKPDDLDKKECTNLIKFTRIKHELRKAAGRNYRKQLDSRKVKVLTCENHCITGDLTDCFDCWQDHMVESGLEALRLLELQDEVPEDDDNTEELVSTVNDIQASMVVLSKRMAKAAK